MSFGVGVGDIIAVANLATNIYQRLSGALEEHNKFAFHVFEIKSILEMLKETIGSTVTLPSDQERIAHLVQGCNSVLNDLQKVIDKYEKVGQRKFTRTIGYVSTALSDNSELQQNLNTQLLLLQSFQLGLASRSQETIRRALISISKQIQSGQRTDSIFEGTILEEKNVDQIWPRIQNELEDEGVGQETISQHKPYILDWVEKALAAGDLDEKVPMDEAQIQSAAPSRPPSPNAEITTQQRIDALIRHKPDASAIKTLANLERVTQESPMAIPIRPPSACSHRSQNETWRRMNGPDVEYVHRVLLRLAHPDAKFLNDRDTRQLLMRRAFCQMDWEETGGLLRHVVVSAWQSVTEITTPTFPHHELKLIARSEDRNKDGIIDLQEFLTVSEKIIDKIERIHDHDLQKVIEEATFKASRTETTALEASRKANPSRALLPWGWVFVEPGTFRDTISLYETSSLPAVDHRSLSCMAYFSAPRSLSRIHQIMDDYRNMCDAEGEAADPAIKEALTTIKTAALKFSLLESQNESETISDIEKLAIESSILYTVGSEYTYPTIEGVSAEAIRIQTITAAFSTLMDHVLAFLQTIDDACSNPTDHINGVREFCKTTWPAKRMEARARLLSAQLATWHEVESDIQHCREWGRKHPQIASLAIQIAKSENAKATSELRQRIQTRDLIEKTLFPREPVISMRVVSASISVKSKWSKLGRQPSPFAVIFQRAGEKEKQFATKCAQKTTIPRWDEPFTPVVFSVGRDVATQIAVFDNDKGAVSNKERLGHALLSVVDLNNSDDTFRSYGTISNSVAPNLALEDASCAYSLFKPFSGILNLNLSKGGQVTVEVAWPGLVNQVRDLDASLIDYVDSLAGDKRVFCLKLFKEDLEAIAFERAQGGEKIDVDGGGEEGGLLGLERGWRLRRVGEGFYLRG